MAPPAPRPSVTKIHTHHNFPLHQQHVPSNTINVPTIPPQLAPLCRNSKARWPRRISLNAIYRTLFVLLSLLAISLLLAVSIRDSYAYGPPPRPPPQFNNNKRYANFFSFRPFKLAYPFDYDSDVIYEHEDSTFFRKYASVVKKYPSVSQPQSPYHVAAVRPAIKQPIPEVPEPVIDLESIGADFTKVITDFMDSAPLSSFNRSAIEQHYTLDQNNMHKTAMLVTISNGVAIFTDRFKPAAHGRAESARYIINKIIDDRRKNGLPKLPDVAFLIMVTDGHGAKVATFGSARHWKHWINLIPVPMGNRRGMGHGWGTLLSGWDDYVDTHVTRTHQNYSWESKIEKAFFRGALTMQTYRLGSCNIEHGHMCEIALNWTHINRGILWIRSQKAPHLFDIGFTSIRKKPNSPPNSMDGAPQPVDGIKFIDYQKYKYLINVGNNQDWAERLRNLLFTNSAIIMHEAETQEFFMPLLKPWVHYIPTNIMMTDLVEHVKWAQQNDDKVRQIVQQQHAFARRYINEKSMQLYWDISINEFAIRQRRATGK